MATILRILLALLLACPVFGERYVPVYTSSDLVTALASVLPGDIIHLRNTEPLISNVTFIGIANGSAEEPIIFEGQGLENAYLESTSGSGITLRVIGNNWILRNLTMSESGDGLVLTGSNNLVEYITFQNIRGHGLRISGDHSNSTVRKCVFQNVTNAGIYITGRGSGNNIINNEFVAVGQARCAIYRSALDQTCCGYIAGNRFYTRGNGSWVNYVIHTGYFYRYHNNYGASVRNDGFYILGGSQLNEFRGNHCDKVESTTNYCIYQDSDSNGTFVYFDNTCNECALTNVAVIDA